MDKVFDFFKDLKERISSPFFSSFIISWIAFNWMFIVTLFKYDVTGFTIFYYTTYIDYANSLLSPWKSIWLPLISAFSYSLFYPFLRNGIEIADVWFKKWGNNSKIKVAKGSYISVEKYIKLREIYESRTQTLDNVLKKESEIIEKNEMMIDEINKYKQENNELRDSITSMTKEKNDLNIKLQSLQRSNESLQIHLDKYLDKENAKKNINRIEFLNGKWQLKTDGILHAKFGNIHQILFNDGIAYSINEFEIPIEWFQITAYEYNDITKVIRIKTNLTINENVLMFNLKPNNTLTELTGQSTIASTYVLKFIRIPENNDETFKLENGNIIL